MPVGNFPAMPNGVTIRKIADTRRVIRISEVRRSERKIPMTAPFHGMSVAPEESLSHYLKEIRKFPMLQADEELRLARRWTRHEDTKSAHKLVTSHPRLVAKIAMGYRGYGLPLGERISEGNVGLMQAVKRFDPERGFRFSTYAMWWIRAAIQEYILHSWSLVKMGTTAAQKKLFFYLRKLKNRIEIIEDGELAPEHVTSSTKRFVERFGKDAPRQATIRANELRAAGHVEEFDIWMSIYSEVKSLLDEGPKKR